MTERQWFTQIAFEKLENLGLGFFNTINVVSKLLLLCLTKMKVHYVNQKKITEYTIGLVFAPLLDRG